MPFPPWIVELDRIHDRNLRHRGTEMEHSAVKKLNKLDNGIFFFFQVHTHMSHFETGKRTRKDDFARNARKPIVDNRKSKNVMVYTLQTNKEGAIGNARKDMGLLVVKMVMLRSMPMVIRLQGLLNTLSLSNLDFHKDLAQPPLQPVILQLASA